MLQTSTENMYYVATKSGLTKNNCGDARVFNGYDNARNWAIDFCDQSDNRLSIISHAELIQQMREWLLDCFEDDYEQEEIQQLNFEEVQDAVQRYYDGGITGFIESI